MADHYKSRFDTLIKSILSHLPNGTPPLLRQFVAHYYAKMPLMDLEEIDPHEACLIAQNSFEFYRDKPLIEQMRAFRPAKDEHGWDAPYLVIEVHNNDSAFILDSLTAELTRQGFSFVETIHPVLYQKRDKQGVVKEMVELGEDGSLPSGAIVESFIHFQLGSVPADLDIEKLLNDLHRVLESVRLVNADWKPMSAKALDVAKRIDKVSRYFDEDELQEVKDFLHWLRDKNFVFLGYVEYDFYDKKGNECLDIVAGSEMGIFKSHNEQRPQALSALPPEVMQFAREPHLIEITKSSRKSAVHRPVLMDYIVIKRFNEGGKVIGECRFLGLFTSTVYYQSADRIPFIRRKIARTLMRANFDPHTHSAKQLKAILEFYPRDELFQISEEDLLNFSIGLMSLEAKPDVQLFVRKERFERYVSCMVYIPRERFNTYLRERISEILRAAFQGEVTAFYTQMTDSPLARVHLIIATKPGHIPAVDITAVEAEIARITNRWADSLRRALTESHENAKEAESLAARYMKAFPESYIQHNDAKDAVSDIAKIEQAIAENGLAVDLFRRKREPDNQFHVKIYTYESERALSEMIPMLENLGCTVMDVTPYVVRPARVESSIIMRDFVLRIDEQKGIKLTRRKATFEEALQRIWAGDAADDGFNALVLLAGLNWREVLILRAYSHYLRQIGFSYSQSYVAAALGRHPTATRRIIDLFLEKFTPQTRCQQDDATFRGYLVEIDHYLDNVANISEDRIIRTFLNLIQATLRTNYFQKAESDTHKPYLSYKFRSNLVPDLPKPVPFAEIFVYSQSTEGIHLRGGAVARGGLRWSDRSEDFRTEVLGLMKAQMVKNAVIVPTGSKGGFVVKNPPKDSDRDVQLAAGIASYKEFLCGLLDITDNITDKGVAHPANVICYDGEDPYLVVAADKGTASFSDIANSVAADYGFWLGDAFASGGSAGYDHKEMAITARGAWVSVERHFREMGRDIRQDDFTVIGIGDMSGDVFGNGMLLSEHICLLGAFNHRHIFLDPNPDPRKSFKERKRLFDLPRSGWNDYSEKLISKGGGIFPRDLKVIPLSKEVRAMLGTEDAQMSPDMIIRLMLQAPVDLLWNGGIGTYVKASSESNEEVGDRINNTLRINGDELRCKVVGEGGNLGFTQRGRIEYARAGGRINTDAIDNSAGVDCSDHEVNIKIALGDALQKGALTLEKRNELLESMTDNVAELVLIDNKLQTQALSVAERRGPEQLEAQARMMHRLEQADFLDRTVEFLPSDKMLHEFRFNKIGLTRPELAVLLSYSKLALYRELHNSSVVESDYFIADLLRYFPKAMQEHYREAILNHRLRREIIATSITNSLVNRAGITFVDSLVEETGMHPCDVARAYVISRDAFGLRDLWRQIEASSVIDADTQALMIIEVTAFLERITRWFLNNCAEPLNIAVVMQEYAEGIRQFKDCAEELMSDTLRRAYNEHKEQLQSRAVPSELAHPIALLEMLSSAPDVVHVSNHYKLDVKTAGQVYFEIGAQLRMGWLRRCANHILSEGYWDRLALKSLIRELYVQQRRLTSHVVETLCDDDKCDYSVTRWSEQNKREIERYNRFIMDLKSQEVVDISMLIVAVRHIEAICSAERQ